MKIARLLAIIFSIVSCFGCAKPIMPSLKYNKPIDFHVAKNAYINWEIGKQHTSTIPSSTSYNNAGLIGGLISAAVESVDRDRRPSLYMVSYGKAEQAIFMTSLKDTLSRNNVFKEVELITDPSSVRPQDVLINIYFKMARVGSPEKNYKIVLSVEMSITTAGKAPYKRTYLAESAATGFGKGIIDQKIDASEKLLEKIILGIQEWNTQLRKT